MPQNSKATAEAATDLKVKRHPLVALRSDYVRLEKTASEIVVKRECCMASGIAEGYGETKHHV